jgi:hypothetical protein
MLVEAKENTSLKNLKTQSSSKTRPETSLLKTLICKPLACNQILKFKPAKFISKQTTFIQKLELLQIKMIQMQTTFSNLETTAFILCKS